MEAYTVDPWQSAIRHHSAGQYLTTDTNDYKLELMKKKKSMDYRLTDEDFTFMEDDMEMGWDDTVEDGDGDIFSEEYMDEGESDASAPEPGSYMELLQMAKAKYKPVFSTRKDTLRLPMIPLTSGVPFSLSGIYTNEVIPESMWPYLKQFAEEKVPVVFTIQDAEGVYGPVDTLMPIAVTGIIDRFTTPDKARGEDFCRLRLFGWERARLLKIFPPEKKHPYFTADVVHFPMEMDSDVMEQTALYHELWESCDELYKFNKNSIPAPEEIATLDPLTAFMSTLSVLPVKTVYKMEAFKQPKFSKFAEEVLMQVNEMRKVMRLRQEIHERTTEEMSMAQRDNYLQHQLGVIQNELGQTSDSDADNLRKAASEKNWSEDTQKHFERELAKLQRYTPSSPDYSIQYAYLDTFVKLPWGYYTPSDFDFDKVEATLERDHFGLEKVKERIMEQIAIAKLRDDNKAPILCLVGPPGVGKTSLGKSIAESMGREYVRVSFGGMHDEAEIRGHRRTYLGAMPGRIITSLSKIETSNPVMMLDEIDKIGKDFKGDPANALLEVLDPEQNSTFHDNYIDADYDLSNILFIATANSLDTVSAPLLDRMEIISIPGYITEEKIEIARRHLVRKQLKENGFGEDEVEFDIEALRYLIDYHTHESGVRRLEKSIGRVLRKLAVKKVRGQEIPKVVDKALVSLLLGKEEYSPERYETNEFTGVVTGLAWTSVGGEILFIESSATEGKGKLSLTGNLGDVMKESATLALQYLKSHADILGLKSEDFDKKDFHIHVPEGAIPKDGPSAGITMVTSLASTMTGRKVKGRLAMTGEITLRGKVIPVGGIKEKIIAAKRAGITDIILCRENAKDIADINERYLQGLSFHYVDRISDVLDLALV